MHMIKLKLIYLQTKPSTFRMCKLPSVLLSIHSVYIETRVYTPGWFGWAHPYPQLVIPYKVHRSGVQQTKGPPESHLTTQVKCGHEILHTQTSLQ